MRRLMLAGGGTGGHVYPLLAVLEALPQGSDVLYLGRRGSVEERLAAKHNVPFGPMPAAAVRGMAPWRVVANLGRVTAGVGQALAAMRRFAPDAVLVTGGYVSVPAALAAWLLRRPLVVCLPDMEPGMAVRFLARLADRVTVSCPEVQGALPQGKTVVTGYPVRRAFCEGDRTTARQRLGIAPEERLLVIMGGSSGARNINNAVLGCLPELLQMASVWHITGNLDCERVRQAAEAALPESPLHGTCADGRYRIYSYVEGEMADLLRAADLVVARAGAATLGEFPAVGVPSVVVPGSFAGGHQTPNATYLRDHGASVMVADDDLAEQLLPTVRELLQDPQRLASMAAAARRLANPQASRAIVAELQRAAQGRGRSGRR
ncbi:MAG TPA: UDP-N-acetylglucosamine--N-acetylmuramyl-(pentapeptide) pyrophosphoryl-undecaprenol N-acetylglucosamine transferase [Anaerolineae bacterium]|nr:UDP-N-acetylglucosamine--N-acetylmuramyl-(pentapeptide) pyrophosphoryl-undecaprenol N-acetylglucosamine transferase [Anaerolineae bacterium]HPL26988.1 UDP-N-acetylglucosamine--N-acetylmuramyl-(pentapeptide) pyrophosphoryl-undecaprenol N-acetylglucosamine transferase [Anaerolineae bacterium]